MPGITTTGTDMDGVALLHQAGYKHACNTTTIHGVRIIHPQQDVVHPKANCGEGGGTLSQEPMLSLQRPIHPQPQGAVQAALYDQSHRRRAAGATLQGGPDRFSTCTNRDSATLWAHNVGVGDHQWLFPGGATQLQLNPQFRGLGGDRTGRTMTATPFRPPHGCGQWGPH
jgi:hypothetical protein